MLIEAKKKIITVFMTVVMLFSLFSPAGIVKSAETDEITRLDQVDYSREENWAYSGQGEGKDADVFLICPTVDTKSEYNMPLENEKVKKNFYNALEMERGIYKASGRLFAPYYRQASLLAYQMNEADREKYLEMAYKDISDAFLWYLEHKNEGRPIVLAGFSQGADMCIRILKEYFGEETLRKKLVAVYAIGWSVTEEMTKEYPQIVPAQGETDFGTVISFDCESEAVEDSIVIPKGVKAVSINPLNWKTDGTKADKALNKGACFMSGADISREEKELCGCYIDEKRGALKVTDVSPEEYDSSLGGVFPGGSYHIYDYQFFYRNLQENVGKRLEAYLLANAAAEETKISLDAQIIKVSGLKKSYVHTGKRIKPGVTVKYNGAALREGIDYQLSFSNNKKVGKATVKINGIGSYTGTISKSFEILPKTAKLVKVKKRKTSLVLKWKKQTVQTDGYEIRYSTSRKFLSAKTKKLSVKNKKATGITIKKPKSKTKYYVQIRTYKKVSKKKYYSEWSGTMSAKA